MGTVTTTPWKKLLVDAIDSNSHLRHSSFFHLVEELRRCPFAEICWYFTDSWEQFRINGTVDVIDGTDSDPSKLLHREKFWSESSLKSRLQYLGPNPGLPSLDDQPPEEPVFDNSSSPVDAFCVLVLDPDQVEYLNLRSNQRHKFTRTEFANGEKQWSSERVNP